MGIDHNLVLYSPTSRRDVTVNSAPFSQQHDPFDGGEVLGLTSYTQYGGVSNNLTPTSPSMLVNGGILVQGITPVVDKNGGPRDSQPDIGAYEYGGTAVQLLISVAGAILGSFQLNEIMRVNMNIQFLI